LKNRKPNASAMRPFAVRVPVGLYNYLAEQAELNGTTPGDIVRRSCEHYRDHLSMKDTLIQLEQRFFRKVFESQCAVVGLTSTEREQAYHELRKRLKEKLA